MNDVKWTNWMRRVEIILPLMPLFIAWIPCSCCCQTDRWLLALATKFPTINPLGVYSKKREGIRFRLLNMNIPRGMKARLKSSSLTRTNASNRVKPNATGKSPRWLLMNFATRATTARAFTTWTLVKTERKRGNLEEIRIFQTINSILLRFPIYNENRKTLRQYDAYSRFVLSNVPNYVFYYVQSSNAFLLYISVSFCENVTKFSSV